jgi:mannose/cellobiose epimerase-like protein (N-acyl-D-glucosamine 2-epimerase family)
VIEPQRVALNSFPDFTGVTDVQSANTALHAWMFEHALPFWGKVGHAGTGLGAHEHLKLDGSPSHVTYKRMRVQARQIYAYSHAALLGWAPGEQLARDGYAFITRFGERPDGGWARRLSPSGNHVVDAAADLYDQAFVLLGLAWYSRLTSDNNALQRARRTVEWIRSCMAAAPEGFHNVIPVEPGHRQQNPHMHLLEAVLALQETSGEAYYAEFAEELVALFRDHLFDSKTGTLGEFFTEDWLPAPGEPGDHVEPGHHYEWVCLLDQYERQTGMGATKEIDQLYDFARRHGTDEKTALVWDVVARSGKSRQRSIRLWCQTEALKAHAVMAQRGGDSARLIPRTVRNLGERFLANCPSGTWIDQFDPLGTPISDKIPTSSFYHLFTGYAELRKLATANGQTNGAQHRQSAPPPLLRLFDAGRMTGRPRSKP